jgi:hypothetical protein
MSVADSTPITRLSDTTGTAWTLSASIRRAGLADRDRLGQRERDRRHDISHDPADLVDMPVSATGVGLAHLGVAALVLRDHQIGLADDADRPAIGIDDGYRLMP